VGERRPSGQYNARPCTNKRRSARRSERRRGGAVGEKQRADAKAPPSSQRPPTKRAMTWAVYAVDAQISRRSDYKAMGGL